MSRGDSSGELRVDRVVFGDCTNRPGKRGISHVSDDAEGKLCNRKEKGIVVGDGDRRFGKHVPLGKENSKAEASLLLMEEKEGRGSGIGDVGFASRNLIHYLPELPGEKEMDSHSHCDPGNVDEESRASSLLEGGDASRDSFRSIITASKSQASGKTMPPEIDASKVTLDCLVQESAVGGCGYLDCGMGNNDTFFGNVTSTVSVSLGSKSFDFKGEGCINQSPGDDLLKTCSCSFCLKAAYIWSDLHYQDIKGRLTALGKSQREVASFIRRIDRSKSGVPHGASDSEKTSKLESDLKNQWKSLFLHMQNSLIQESSQCQAGYLELKDLREKCKMDLEAINKTSSSKQ